MENFVTIKRVLIVRNDSSTAWQTSDYVLERGELGIAWLSTNTQEKPIVKAGDGVHRWRELPQTEYVFQEDLKISHSFGRHTVENGSVNAGGAGMTISEWIKDALVTTQAPIIRQPSFDFSIADIETDTGTKEIGSNVTKIKWESHFDPGFYEYGSNKDRNDFTPDLPVGYRIKYNGELIVDTTDALAPTGEITELNYQITKVGDNDCGEFEGYCHWGTAQNKPVNNLGEEVPGQIMSSSTTLTIPCAIQGYREGCFYGGLVGEINVESIRALEKTGTNYTNGKEINYIVQPGSEKFVIVYPTGQTGPTSIYNSSVNAEMWVEGNFSISTLQIPGANEYGPVDYQVCVYEPADPYINPAELKIKLG